MNSPINKLMDTIFSVERIQHFIQVNTSHSEKEALKMAYQTRMMIVSILFTVPVLIAVSFTGQLPECAIILITAKLIREQIGGIHVKGYLKCFSCSAIIIFFCLWLSEHVTLTPTIEILLFFWILLVSIRYVPRGTSYRPITKPEEIRKLRIRFFLILIVILVARFFLSVLYPMLLWTVSIMLLTVTNTAYQVFHVKTHRQQVQKL